MEFMFGRIKVFGKDEFVPKYNRDGYEIIRDYCGQNDIHKDGNVVCPKCKSKNIIMQKGDGHDIYGLDEIAIICNDCKKVIEVQDDLLEELEERIRNTYGFDILDHSVKFFGICSECKNKKEN